ncbi:hypothetical protein BO71DRAFT_380628 [Aspergillus ellipticus CBS 707.79]|uniref:Zn(2)-C6 fungal-type domain-containing protein n=1 Tax=Aspergillus ellipticus CBS 707.79 TaxID=1448320 RepID=A0A319DIF0_9EURO|nr:hypothetical protein BO71DRAFT_380628 [Aspergillus ellipticus CBS 707.79]
MAPGRSPVGAQVYGRACLNCSRSKCKCVRRPDSQACDRCHRLKRSCVTETSVRALKSAGNSPVSRINQLEGKIDSLVSLLGTGRTFDIPHLDTSLSSSSSLPSEPTPTSFPDEPSPDECLDIFRSRMLKYFPFLHIPQNAQCLQQERPFLLLCIKAAVIPDTKTKLTLGQKIKQTLTQRIFLDTKPAAVGIDLLLGLLTFLAWGHDHMLDGTPAKVSRFTQLAMTLAYDLRLNRPSLDDSHLLPIGRGCPSQRGHPTRSMEERRAILACFLLSSLVSSFFIQIDAMNWTPYMDECLDILSQSKESPYDEIFAHQVRLQRITAEAEGIKGTTTILSDLYLSALRRRVDDVKAHISPEIQQENILLASIHFTELSIFKPIISNQAIPTLEKLEHLYTCLQVVKAALDNFFKIPIAKYHGVSFPFFMQFARYIITLYQLSTLNDPSWDTAIVRSTIDILQVLDQLVSNMERARALEDERSADGLLDRSITKFRATRAWCAGKLAQDVDVGGFGDFATGEGEMQLDALFLDDIWLRDYLYLGG